MHRYLTIYNSISIETFFNFFNFSTYSFFHFFIFIFQQERKHRENSKRTFFFVSFFVAIQIKGGTRNLRILFWCSHTSRSDLLFRFSGRSSSGPGMRARNKKRSFFTVVEMVFRYMKWPGFSEQLEGEVLRPPPFNSATQSKSKIVRSNSVPVFTSSPARWCASVLIGASSQWQLPFFSIFSSGVLISGGQFRCRHCAEAFSSRSKFQRRFISTSTFWFPKHVKLLPQTNDTFFEANDSLTYHADDDIATSGRRLRIDI